MEPEFLKEFEEWIFEGCKTKIKEGHKVIPSELVNSDNLEQKRYCPLGTVFPNSNDENQVRAPLASMCDTIQLKMFEARSFIVAFENGEISKYKDMETDPWCDIDMFNLGLKFRKYALEGWKVFNEPNPNGGTTTA